MTSSPRRGPVIVHGTPTKAPKAKKPSKAGEVAKAVGGKVLKVMQDGLNVAGGVLSETGKSTLKVGRRGYDATRKKLNTRRRKVIALGVTAAIAGLGVGVPLAISHRNAANDASQKAAETQRMENLQPFSSIILNVNVKNVDHRPTIDWKDIQKTGIKVQKGGVELKPTKINLEETSRPMGMGGYRTSGSLEFDTKKDGHFVYNFAADFDREDVDGKPITVVATLAQ